jgi:hypothetical protein
MCDVVVIEEWGVIDRWWTDTPYRADFVVVSFMGRKFTFKKTNEDPVWRIVEAWRNIE